MILIFLSTWHKLQFAAEYAHSNCTRLARQASHGQSSASLSAHNRMIFVQTQRPACLFIEWFTIFDRVFDVEAEPYFHFSHLLYGDPHLK